jgi:hypothetical protein
MENRIGEVTEASTTEFTAQCYELFQLPALGSLVKTGDNGTELYGIVYHAATASLEPGRRPVARGKDEATADAIYQSNPQLLKLLRSEFTVLVAGFRQDGIIRQYLPPQPARVHSFVYRCSPEEIKEYGKSFIFLSLLLNEHLPIAMEELVAAALRQMSEEQDDKRAFLVAAGKELTTLLGGQFPQLRAILGRLPV